MALDQLGQAIGVDLTAPAPRQASQGAGRKEVGPKGRTAAVVRSDDKLQPPSVLEDARPVVAPLGSALRNAVKAKLSNLRFAFAAPLAYRPGHFYSPICDPAELKRRYRDPDAALPPASLPGIDLAHAAQVRLWDAWTLFLADARGIGHDPAGRYRLPSRSYDVGDATIYQCMLRHLRPGLIIEVGCGSSSALALDTIDRFLSGERPRCVFVEPYPDYLHSLLGPSDRSSLEILAVPVQDVPASRFTELGRDDILFIDSTHVLKTGSDVAFELFEILPRLRSGVVVHFHDVFYPFEYPKDWVLGRNYSWNEVYALRAFLTGNRDWEILFFNDYFVRTEPERVRVAAPGILANPGGGLWLRRR